ncbi:MAG: LamG domain-containing protein [Planctomycetota bacterium]|jgi:hypothetical protein
MWRKLIFLISFVLLLGSAGTASAELVAHYTFDDYTASDSAGYYENADGTFYGDAHAVSDVNRGPVLSLDGAEDYVRVENSEVANFSTESFSFAFWTKVAEKKELYYFWRGTNIDPPPDDTNLVGVNTYRDDSDQIRFTLYNYELGSELKKRTNVLDANFMPPNVTGWVHITAVRDASVHELRFYRNGELEPPAPEGKNPEVDEVRDISNDGKLYIGANDRGYPDPKPSYFYKGLIDDFRIYNHALTVAEIRAVMFGDPNIASEPSPENGSQNECLEVVLRWKPGENAAATNGHDVYFGTDRTSVKDADTVLHLGVYKGRQDPNRYPVSSTLNLDLDTVYYWRIDEVNGSDVWKGDVWTFKINDGNAFDPDPQHNATLVPLYANLNWTPGCLATSQDVYFGTDYNDVRLGIGGTFEASLGAGETSYDPDPCDLDYYTVYHWRIDSNVAGQMWKGHIWSFRTRSKVEDPNLVVWYEFDEGQGEWAYDSSGHEYDIYSSSFDAGNWDATGGRFEGCIVFDSNLGLDVPQAALGAINKEITICVWANGLATQDDDDDMVIFDAGDFSDDLVDEVGEDLFKLTGVVPTDDGTVGWRAGNDSNDLLEWKPATPGAWKEYWHHFAFVKNENTGTMSIYFDGQDVESKSGATSSLTNIVGKPFKIGAYNTHSDDYEGKLDNFRVYDYALSASRIAGLFRGGDLNIAWGPGPYHGEREVPRDVNLAWRPGDYAAHHKVFFGTGWEDVNNMTDPCATTTLGDENYDPPGHLELERTYYWRVDEINDVNMDNWKGNIWRFQVANYLIVEDFESYGVVSSPVYDVWLPGTRFVPYPPYYIYVNGSVTSLGASYAQPADPVHMGRQSLVLDYLNDGMQDTVPYYSETERTFDPPQDWTEAGVKTLTLFFYGDPNNDANDVDRMYVILEDSRGESSGAKVPYGYYVDEDMNDIKEDDWQEWNIGLADFAGVDLNDVNKIRIGFGDKDGAVPGGEGTVHFDSIRLYLPKCIARRDKPRLDFTYDCVVDFGELEMMAEKWLNTDVNFADANVIVQPPAPGPIAWWKLDEAGGATANDSVGTNHGTIEGHFSWVTGYDGVNTALKFSKAGGRVLVPDAPALRPPDRVSACAWVYYTQPFEHNGRIVVKGGEDKETYMLEVNEDDELSFTICDINDEDYTAGSENRLGHNEWIHTAGTYDNNEMRVYVNGQLDDSKSTGAIILSQDPNGLAIGNRSDDDDQVFVGIIDDVQFYNRALSQAEVAWLASDGTGYVPLTSELNLYDAEPKYHKVINLRDAAVLADAWLERKLWPAP